MRHVKREVITILCLGRSRRLLKNKHFGHYWKLSEIHYKNGWYLKKEPVQRQQAMEDQMCPRTADYSGYN